MYTYYILFHSYPKPLSGRTQVRRVFAYNDMLRAHQSCQIANNRVQRHYGLICVKDARSRGARP